MILKFDGRESNIRIFAKDGGAPDPKGQPSHIGCISFTLDLFKFVSEDQYGKLFKQWITLFDDEDDDEFDGELGEDDEEMPMI